MVGTECHHPHSVKERHIAIHSSRKIKLKFHNLLLFGSYANYNVLKMGDTDRLIAPTPLVQLHRTDAEKSWSRKRASERVSVLPMVGASLAP